MKKITLTENDIRNMVKACLMEMAEHPLNNMARQIMDRLKEYRIEERGHNVRVFMDDTDEFPEEIAVYGMNVPTLADCRSIADEVGCEFKYEPSFDMGYFILY